VSGQYSTPRWRRLRETIRADCARRGVPCGFCGRPIDTTLPYADPWSFQVDHVKPAATHPELFWRRDNLQPAHKVCNISRCAVAPPRFTEWVAPTW
jgi:5-methylcytosine-specific restriction endonuclease McrA